MLDVLFTFRFLRISMRSPSPVSTVVSMIQPTRKSKLIVGQKAELCLATRQSNEHG